MMAWVFLFGAVLLNALASISLKFASQQKLPIKPSAVEPILVLGYLGSAALYVGAFVLYAVSLRGLPLHVAHPLSTALPIVIVAISSVALFGEKIGVVALLGLALIAIGAIALGVSFR